MALRKHAKTIASHCLPYATISVLIATYMANSYSKLKYDCFGGHFTSHTAGYTHRTHVSAGIEKTLHTLMVLQY